jgi:RND superfamily putative drug exporter
MSRLTEFVLRHRLLVVMFWLLVAVAGAATAQTTTHRMSQTFTLPSSPAAQTDALISQGYRAGGGADPNAVVITLPAGSTVDSPGVRGQLAQTLGAARSVGGRVVDYPGTGDRAFVTADGSSAYALVFVPQRGQDPGAAAAASLQQAVSAAAPPGWQVRVTGTGPLAQAPSTTKGNSLIVETLVGGLGALVVLAFVYASFVAVLPLLIAAVSILGTFLLVLALTVGVEVNFIAEFIIGLIGLGVAIDYSLLVVTRWREERARGASNRDAVRTAMRRAGRAVAFSGLTVTIGLLTLVVLPVPALRSFGYAGALIPLVSVAVTMTLLPVLLDAVGPVLDWPRHRLHHEDKPSRAWTAWARLAVRRRWVMAVLGLAALAALAAPVLHLQLGSARTAALAQSGPAREALTTMTGGGVPSGVLTPMTVLVSADRADAVAATARGIAGVRAAVAPSNVDNRQRGTVLVTVLPTDEGTSGAGKATVARVRGALSGTPGVLGVTGSGAGQADFQHAVYGTLPWMLAAVSLLTFILLARAFRSIVLPAKAVLLNLISLGAAYGVLVLVWQDGHGSMAVWSNPATGAIATWVPLMVFAFLFGLSMDYEVFLLARMREAYDDGHNTDAAVITGLSRTGRLVTAAALILCLSFLSMSTAPAVDVRVLATGLGAGILVDATVVRCLLVPALVSLFGRWNWWLPGRAARLLRVPPSGLRLAAVPSPTVYHAAEEGTEAASNVRDRRPDGLGGRGGGTGITDHVEDKQRDRNPAEDLLRH